MYLTFVVLAALGVIFAAAAAISALARSIGSRRFDNEQNRGSKTEERRK